MYILILACDFPVNGLMIKEPVYPLLYIHEKKLKWINGQISIEIILPDLNHSHVYIEGHYQVAREGHFQDENNCCMSSKGGGCI